MIAMVDNERDKSSSPRHARVLEKLPPPEDWRDLAPKRLTQPKPLHLAAVPSEVRNARRYAEQVLEDFGLDEDRAYEISLVVSELVTNAVRAVADYGMAATPDATPVVVLLEWRRHWTHIFVTDPIPYMSERPQKEPLAKSGRGLDIVDTYAVRWTEYCGASGKTTHAVIAHPNERLLPIEIRLLERGVLR